MYCKQATTAANWWIEQMKERCRYLYPNKVTEDDSKLIIVDKKMAEDFSRFKSILTEEIQQHLENHHYISFSCYHLPNHDLEKIARKAHISNSYFPLRATMQIWDKSIEVTTNGDEFQKLPLNAGKL